ncbi:DUF3726 domain-containing protein [Rhodoligotrophos defluvii]|uniref:DUF3726 domain-containing protein n=1 Tax=Rhodoligotrophos defluvii TaxID=2561934 RepID=UPI0014853C92|nr:DUF3726 domain-containing protein [Rhodoligotrophos defluvii]
MTEPGSQGATPLARPPGMIDLSMNEVEMTAYKAARGAGLPWGIAEDVGRAARWLARTGFDWSTALLSVLATTGMSEPATSPFLLGTAVADQINGGEDVGRVISRPNVLRPVWLVPLITVATGGSMPVRIVIGAELVAINREKVWATAPIDRVAPIASAYVLIQAGLPELSALPHHWDPQHTRSLISAENHTQLEALVYRTYVPTSEKSRLRGAGGRPGG